MADWNWNNCKNILCIRPDNMGDLIMSGPAIRALKDSFNAKITVLTSSMAKDIIPYMPEIDDCIVFDMPWVKTNEAVDPDQLNNIIGILKEKQFDAAVIFTVYSQNPLPAAMLPYMAGIPRILAYCRENPYKLLTHWIPDKEPYEFIKHQVRRDLDLVKAIGAVPLCESQCLKADNLWENVKQKLTIAGIKNDEPWLIMHAGVSEKKRQYPFDKWVETGKRLINELGYQVILTGSKSEKELTDKLHAAIGKGSFSLGGCFQLDELISLIKNCSLIISVNTGTVHIAAAVGTPVVVLYAQTNPQHTPWKTMSKVLQFPVAAHLRSNNEVLAYVNQKLYAEPIAMPGPVDIITAAKELLYATGLSSQQFPGIPNENQAIAAN